MNFMRSSWLTLHTIRRRRKSYAREVEFIAAPKYQMEFSRRLRRAGQVAVLTHRWNPPPGGMRPGAHDAPRSRTGSLSRSIRAGSRRIICIAGITASNGSHLTNQSFSSRRSKKCAGVVAAADVRAGHSPTPRPQRPARSRSTNSAGVVAASRACRVPS